MTNTRTHTGKSCMSIHASVCRSMTCYRPDSFYRSITPECRREDYTRCCEGHVMFNDCCVSEYMCTLTMLGIYTLYYWVRWMCCDLHVLMKGVSIIYNLYAVICCRYSGYWCNHKASGDSHQRRISSWVCGQNRLKNIQHQW